MKFWIKTSWYLCPVYLPKTGEIRQTMMSGGTGIYDLRVATPLEFNPQWTAEKDENRFFYVWSQFEDPDTHEPYEGVLELLAEFPVEILEISEEEKVLVHR